MIMWLGQEFYQDIISANRISLITVFSFYTKDSKKKNFFFVYQDSEKVFFRISLFKFMCFVCSCFVYQVAIVCFLLLSSQLGQAARNDLHEILSVLQKHLS